MMSADRKVARRVKISKAHQDQIPIARLERPRWIWLERLEIVSREKRFTLLVSVK